MVADWFYGITAKSATAQAKRERKNEMAMKTAEEWQPEMNESKPFEDECQFIRRIQADAIRYCIPNVTKIDWRNQLTAEADELDPKKEIVVEQYVTTTDGNMRVEQPKKESHERH